MAQPPNHPKEETNRLDAAPAASDRLAADRLLASIVESSDDAIVSKSLDGIILSWNAGAERLFGYSAEEVVGRHISIIIPAERASEEDRIIARIRAGERVDHFDTVRVRRDGRRVDVSLTISPVTDAAGRIVGASKIARDVTERKRAETQLIAATAKFEAVFNQSGIFAGIMDLDGTLREANDLSVEGCGYTRGEVLDRALWETPWWRGSEAAKARIREAAREAAAGSVFREELPYWLADGTERIVDFAMYPIRDRAGSVIHIHPTGTDITEHRKSDQALRDGEASLQAAMGALRDADRRKDEFLATLAHELRNPLAPIRNAIHVLRQRDGDAASVRAMTEMLERQVKQLVRLVDDLLDVSRISRGRIELRRERIELAPILKQVVEAARPLAQDMEHALIVKMPPQPIFVEADPARLAQVVGNLLNNACKFMDRGGRVELTVERAGDEALIRVRDRGVGIAPDDLPKIFDMFMQVDTSLERSVGGLGIGLTLVRSLVEMHGGTVSVSSDGPGQGSEFVVRLPALPANAEMLAEPAIAPAPLTTSGRVLVVDDNRDGAESLSLLLQTLGYVTRTAHDGIAAVEAAREFRPDIALLDIGLPRMNGHDACRRIREQPWGRDMILIAVTGWGQREDQLRSQAAGFDHHLVKPVRPDDLINLLASASPKP